jgi:hypothetical protein
MRLIKDGLAEKAGMKCELNIVTATRNDHKNIGQSHDKDKLKALENVRVSKKGKVY